jgi:hypothetical protein
MSYAKPKCFHMPDDQTSLHILEHPKSGKCLLQNRRAVEAPGYRMSKTFLKFLDTNGMLSTILVSAVAIFVRARGRPLKLRFNVWLLPPLPITQILKEYHSLHVGRSGSVFTTDRCVCEE